MIDPARRAAFEALDAEDPLAKLRDEFALTEGRIYLDGNSLGAPIHAALRALRTAAEDEWRGQLIDAWNDADWIGLPRRLGTRIGRLIGAAPGQVTVCDSISVNLMKLISGALALQPGRTRILSTEDNFPTDLYVAQGLSALLGPARCELVCVPREELASALDDRVALLMLTQVDFRTGVRFDLADMTARAHAVGALTLWDLAHSAGAFPVALDAAQADFAVGCGYKFLGGGPGVPAFLYVAERHLTKLAGELAAQPLSGWMGDARPFEFDGRYAPASGIDRYLVGTPPILACRALEGALDVFDAVDLEDVETKRLALSSALIELIEGSEVADELLLASPRRGEDCGSQVAFRHPEAFALTRALVAEGIVGDFRAPDLLRVGLTPLYLRFVDIFDAACRIEALLTSGRHRDPRFATPTRVT